MFILPFVGGNFIYIDASDLIPGIEHSESLSHDVGNFLAFFGGCVRCTELVCCCKRGVRFRSHEIMDRWNFGSGVKPPVIVVA